VFVITAYDLGPKAKGALQRRRRSDEEAVAEDEASFEETTHTAMEVPVELVPAVRELIAKRKRSA